MSTDRNQEAQVARERAVKDLSAILELQKNSAFQDYFMRRLNATVDRNWKSHKYDGMTFEKREELRVRTIQLEEIAKWTSQEEATSAQSMARPPQGGY